MFNLIFLRTTSSLVRDSICNHLVNGHDVLTWILKVSENRVKELFGLIQADFFCTADAVLKEGILKQIINGVDHAEELRLKLEVTILQ